MSIAGLKIIDATLREGSQTPGVSFSVDDSVLIALALEALRVDMIECGHAAIGDGERNRISAVAGAVDTPVLAHARAYVEDVRAVAAAGAAWVGVFIGVNALSRSARLSERISRRLPEHISASVAEAKAAGLSVRFTVEDASRTPDEELIEAYALAVEAGADRICYADTVGVARPGEVARVVEALKRALPATPLELHLHDDRGLALAAALAGAEAGADWAATTVNGVGERCGIVDTLQLLINLRLETGETVLRDFPDGWAIAAARDLVAGVTGLPVAPQHACTGAYAFTHTSRLHALAVTKDRRAYEAIDPEWSNGRFEVAAAG